MTTKDVLRSQVMAQVLEGKLDQASAAARLGISVRQINATRAADDEPDCRHDLDRAGRYILLPAFWLNCGMIN